MKTCIPHPTSYPYSKDVFLGGACGENTWRHDIAIPFFQKEGISYFDSHVDNWYPELVEIEKVAKSTCLINLFFLDTTKSRCIASFVEAAYLCAKEGKQLVLILNDTTNDPSPLVTSKKISTDEYECICQARKVLAELAIMKDVHVFFNLLDGLECTKRLIYKVHLRSQVNTDLPCEKGDRASPFSADSSSSVYPARSTVADADSAGKHRLRLPQELPVTQEKTDGMCVDTLKREKIGSPKATAVGSSCPFDKDVYMVCSRNVYALDSVAGKVLFGEQLALSLLKQAGVQVVRASPGDEAVHQHPPPDGRVFFYLIRDSALELDIMVEAAFMVGCGLRVVICLQTSILGEHVKTTLQSTGGDAFSQSPCDPVSSLESCCDVAPGDSTSGPGMCTATLPLSISDSFSTALQDCYPTSGISHSLASRDSGLGSPLDSPVADVSGVGGLHLTAVPLDPAGLKDYNRGRIYLASVAEESGTPTVLSAVDKAVERCLSLLSCLPD